MKRLNLVVMAKHQFMLNSFFASILPTIDDRVTIYANTKGLELPDDKRIIRLDMTEFRPGKYFNKVLKELSGQNGYMGIINDDILFHKTWLDDVLGHLENYTGVSAGFIETSDYRYFLQRIEETKDLGGVEEGMHDAFFCFPIKVAEELGGFDEKTVYWYDQDWFLTMLNAGHQWVTSKKVTIQHLVRGTLSQKAVPAKKNQIEIMEKWGRKQQLKFKRNSISLRGKFNV